MPRRGVWARSSWGHEPKGSENHTGHFDAMMTVEVKHVLSGSTVPFDDRSSNSWENPDVEAGVTERRLLESA